MVNRSITRTIILFLFSISLVFSSCGEEGIMVEEKESTIVGSWSGVISQEGYEDFTLNVDITEPIINTVIAKGDYDGNCTFSWTYTRDDMSALIIEEKILSGFDYCIDGTIALTILSESSLLYKWTGSDFDDNFATGTLIRN